MLIVDPEKRLSSKEAFNHPFIQKSMKFEIPLEETKQLLSNLKTFHVFLGMFPYRKKATQKLQQATMLYIATQLMSTKEKDELREIFTKLDKNSDGKLSREELIEGYEKTFGSHEEALKEVKTIMECVDIDHNGFIDYSGIFSL